MIETLLGPIRPEAMQACLTHEHLILYGTGEASIAIREKALRDIVPRLQELRRQYRCNTLVECTPTVSTGRDLITYAEIARRSRFHVIAATGFYTVPRSPWWMRNMTVPNLVRRWNTEVRHGMDGTGIRPGVLKATSGKELSDRRHPNHRLVLRWFEALVRSHRDTGLPITTHVSGNTAVEQLAALIKFGVRPSAVMQCHVDSYGTLNQLLKIADQGAYLSFNCGGGHLDTALGIRQAMRSVKVLVDRGYVGQITLSADAGFWPKESEWLDPDKSHPEGQRPTRAYQTVFTRMIPTLQKLGIHHRQIRQMLVNNPRRHLSGG